MFEFLKRKPFKVSEETTIGELLSYDEKIADVLLEQGMDCVGCPSSRDETIMQACQVHNVYVQDVLWVVRNYIEHN